MQTQEIIDRVEELRENNTKKFVAGWNMVGYLPDSEPQEYDDFDDARDAIIEQMDELADMEDDSHEYQALRSRIEELADLISGVEEQSGEFSVVFYGMAYWVKGEGTSLSDEEKEELKAKEEFLSELVGYNGDLKWEGEWYPSELIEDENFTEHAQELAEDIGMEVSKWPYTCIDWEKAADELKMDYSCADLDGETYWYRT